MPFGDHIKTYIAGVSREDWSNGREMAGIAIQVERGDPPPWWNDYLMDEWKRRHIRDRGRDAQTGWQQDHERWQATIRLWDAADLGLWREREPKKPARHALWEDDRCP